MGVVGIYTWQYIWFIPTKIVATAGFAISGIASLFLLYPIIILLWSQKVAENNVVKKQPLWVIRYISPLAFLFLTWYPLYFFVSLSLPSIYTFFAGKPSVTTLLVSKIYSTNHNSVSKIEKYWVEFSGYSGSIRVKRELYESCRTNHEREAAVSKSTFGTYVFSIN